MFMLIIWATFHNAIKNALGYLFVQIGEYWFSLIQEGHAALPPGKTSRHKAAFRIRHTRTHTQTRAHTHTKLCTQILAQQGEEEVTWGARLQKKKSVNEKKVRKESECEVRWEKVTGWGWGGSSMVGGRRLKRIMHLSNSTEAIT